MLDYHRLLLADEVRVQAFRQAIHEVVRPGDVVADLGTGTGVLACFACQAGAARVYAIERDDIIQIAREVAAANGYQDRIIFVQEDADFVTLPERADVVVGDLIGVAGLEELLLPVYESASLRYLKPDGRVVPQAIQIFFAPWEAPGFYETVDFWGRERYGLDFRPCRPVVVNRLYSTPLDAWGKLAEAQLLWQFSLAGARGGPLSATAEFEIQRGGVLHGFAAWFRVNLSPGVGLCSSPFDPPTTWQQAFFPIEEPIGVHPGDGARLAVTAATSGDTLLWGWSGQVVRGRSEMASFSAHSFRGLPLPLNCFKVMRDGRLPSRSEAGAVLLEILSAMGRETPLKEVADRLWDRFPDHLGSPEAALHQVVVEAARWGRMA